MPKVYDPILCMMVDKPAKARDELSLAQKKQVVVELKGYLKKSYNFSDESEYARAYEDLRRMFTTGSRKSISGLFENTVKKTGAHDSASALDKAIRAVDAANLKELKDDYGRLKNASSIIGNIYSLSSSTKSAIIKAIESGMREIDARIDRAYMK